MRYPYHLFDVFTDRPFGGNPLAVFEPHEPILDERMQQIAAELNLAESVFIYPATDGADFELRIFTPKDEIAFAGHPTIGAMHYLQRQGRGAPTIIFRERAGMVRVTYADEIATLEAPIYPRSLAIALGQAQAARILGLAETEVRLVTAYSAGTPFIVVMTNDDVSVSRIHLDLVAWKEAHEMTGIAYVCAFSMNRGSDGTGHLKVRTFTPSDGIVEDPATGSAVAAIGGLVARDGGFGQYRVTQGAEMGRPSVLSLSVGPYAVHVGGQAVTVGQGFLEL
jgi:trans-2,3-dihydro-3-hydroxyanthranilate isomerase